MRWTITTLLHIALLNNAVLQTCTCAIKYRSVSQSIGVWVNVWPIINQSQDLYIWEINTCTDVLVKFLKYKEYSPTAQTRSHGNLHNSLRYCCCWTPWQTKASMLCYATSTIIQLRSSRNNSFNEYLYQFVVVFAF